MATDTEQLLELLKRAADELKKVRAECEQAQFEAQQYRQQLHQMRSEKNRAIPELGNSLFDSIPSESFETNDGYFEEKTRVQESDAGLLASRLGSLEKEYAQLNEEHQHLKQSLNQEHHALKPDTTGPIEIPSSMNHAELDALKGRRDELNVQLGHVEKERNSLKQKLSEIEMLHRTQLDAHTSAQSAMTQEIDELKQQLRESEVEVAHFQHHTSELQVKFESMQQKVATQETRLHALVAEHARENQRLLAAHEMQLLQVNEVNINEIGALKTQLNQVIAQSNSEREVLLTQHEEAIFQLTQKASTELAQTHAQLYSELQETSRRLEHATGEFHHANKEYEALHREMIVLMEERDEARRLLAEKN